MLKTISFNQMNSFQKAEWLSDMFGEAICSVSYKPYWEMTAEEQAQAKQKFFDYIKHENAIIENDVINYIQSDNLASAVREYLSNNSLISQAAKKLNKLIGEKVTIIKFSDFGFPILFHTVIQKVENKPYAQYDESLIIVHKPKRKRTLWKNIILPNESLLVYKGWINIDKDQLLYDTSKDENMIIRQSKYSSFDDQYLHDVISQYGKPYIKLI